MAGEEKYSVYPLDDRDLIIVGKVSAVYDVSRGKVDENLSEMSPEEFNRTIEPLRKKRLRERVEEIAESVLEKT